MTSILKFLSKKWILGGIAFLCLLALLCGYHSQKGKIKKEIAHLDWMDRVVSAEFAPFEKQGITKSLLDSTWDNCKTYKEFKRFKILDSTVYGDECKIKHLLEALVKRYKIPDVDFIYFNEDRIKPSFFRRKAYKKCAPILVSAKHRSLDKVILFSDWVYDIEDLQKGWNALIKTVNEHQNIDWSQKTDKLFWRGTPWDGPHFGMYNFNNWKTLPRGKLVHESRKHPELIDAAFSEYPLQCVQESLDRCRQEMGEIQFTAWDEVFRFKYQMAIDGVTCSFPATQWKLLSGCLTFKQDSPDIMYFYDELVAWKHYIPVRTDLADLIEKIQWAKNHDAEARVIAQNGRSFALNHLMPEHILLYCYKVLLKYASLQKFQPAQE